MSLASSERNKREYFSLVNFLINDYLVHPGWRNLARVLLRWAKATWVYYKKMGRVR